MDGLRDIHGLDPAPWWPLALGWWVVLGTLALMILLGLLAHRWYWRPRHAWRSDALHELRTLRRRVRRHQGDLAALAGELSELLRRVAVVRYERQDCAGLVEQEWLDWLTAHDSTGFAWNREARVLVEAPYAPRREGAVETLLPLISAAVTWVKSDPVRPAPEPEESQLATAEQA